MFECERLLFRDDQMQRNAMMTIDEARGLIIGPDHALDFLRAMSQLDAQQQQRRSTEIDAAFEVFWETKPGREEFTDAMRGVLLTPRILWTMCRINGEESTAVR